MCNLGQFGLAPLTIQNVKMKKRRKNKKEETKKRKGGTINIVRVSVKASPAEGRRRLHTNTAYVRLWGFNGPSCGASPAGDAPHEGLLKSKGGGLGV